MPGVESAQRVTHEEGTGLIVLQVQCMCVFGHEQNPIRDI